MIQTLRTHTYKNNTIFVMFDAGAHWFEVDDDKNNAHTFITLEAAKGFIDELQKGM